MIVREKKSVGFWARKQDEKSEALPWPADFIDLSWDLEERTDVLAYLCAPTEKIGYRGSSWCRLCAEIMPPPSPGVPRRALNWEMLGSHDFSDGIFVWPEGYFHYVAVHGVKPPREFLEHVLKGKS